MRITTSYGNAHSDPPPRTPAPHARVERPHCQSKYQTRSRGTPGCEPSLLPRQEFPPNPPVSESYQQRTSPRHNQPGGMDCSHRRANANQFRGNQLLLDHLPRRSGSLAFENLGKLLGTFLGRRSFGHRASAQAHQLVAICRLSESDANIRRRAILGECVSLTHEFSVPELITCQLPRILCRRVENRSLSRTGVHTKYKVRLGGG